jgi:hypothetical protein
MDWDETDDHDFSNSEIDYYKEWSQKKTLVRVVQVDAPVEFLKKIEETGLPCKWNGEFLEVSIRLDNKQDLLPNTDDLLKLVNSLSGAKTITIKGIR